MTLLTVLTKPAGLIGTTLGGLLLGLPLMPSAIANPMAQNSSEPINTSETISIPTTGTSVQLSQIRVATTPPVPQNPCPGIYYEAPFNQYMVVPQQCNPNLITQQLDQMGMLQTIRATGNANIPGASGGVMTPYTTPNPAY